MLLESCDDVLTGCCCRVCEQHRQISVWLSYICSLTELFTMNKHAMYCTNILYHVAVRDETTLFDTIEKETAVINVIYLLLF